MSKVAHSGQRPECEVEPCAIVHTQSRTAGASAFENGVRPHAADEVSHAVWLQRPMRNTPKGQ